MMMKSSVLLSLSALCLSVADATTRVAVLELGKGGTVRRTTAASPEASVEGVHSFWNALHAPTRRLQHAGMAMVPDLFDRADSGVVVGIHGSGVDLDTMPVLKNLLLSENHSDKVVGHLQVSDSDCHALLEKANAQELTEASDVATTAVKHSETTGLSGFQTFIDSNNAATVEAQLETLLTDLDAKATASGKTVLIHLVVEEEEAASRRRQLSRRLEDEADEGEQNEGEEEENNQENEQNNNNNNNNNNGQNQGDGNDGYYGYGYYNAYGEWVTPYKTMFQIQYFNVVLWTSIVLLAALFYTIYLMINMPMEADTLLFGESAKVMGDD